MKIVSPAIQAHLQRRLAADNARVTLDSYGIPLEGAWKQLDWKYLIDTFGPKLRDHVRACWKYALAIRLVEVRKGTEFRFR